MLMYDMRVWNTVITKTYICKVFSQLWLDKNMFNTSFEVSYYWVIGEGKTPITGRFPPQPVMREWFYVSMHLYRNKIVPKQSRFKT